MLIILFFLNWLLSLIFLCMNHPLSLGCVLFMQTLLISLASTHLFVNTWFSYILFLIMIGGMLVMFIYMTSIAANEKFTLPNKKMILLVMVLCTLLIPVLLLDKLYSNLMNFLMNNFPFMDFTMNYYYHLTKFFSIPGTFMMITLMIYLLITLIAIVKIAKTNQGPLRKK